MKSKMATVFAALMIALMAVGFAYAHWSETLLISGTVETGKLDLALSFSATDNDDDLKNVADIEWEPLEPEDELFITISNAYPCYKIEGTFDIVNKGTVPAVLKELWFKENDGPWEPVELLPDMKGTIEGLFPAWMGFEVIGWRGDPFGQIHDTAYMDFAIHFLNDPPTPEGFRYTFGFKFVYENWSPPA